MQKFILLLCSGCTMLVVAIGLSSCKDDEPFVKPNLSVASKTATFSEGAGTIEVEVVLDRGAPADLTIEYDLGGTALSPADYSVVGREGEVEIAKGATSGTISIQIVSDAVYEGDETIEVTLEDVNSTDVLITNDDETTVTITDDDPQIKASFAVTTLDVNEEDGFDGLLEIVVNLDKAAPSDVTVQYEIDGTALDSLYAYNEEISPDFYDYFIDGESGEIVIPSGQLSGKIKIQILPDLKLESTETMLFTLASATGGVQLGEAKVMTINLHQQDGTAIALLWEPAATDVDMDMILWVGNPAPFSDVIIAAYEQVTPNEEIIFLPASVYANEDFGLSYIYYSGTKTPLTFDVVFADVKDGVLEPEADRNRFVATYTTANINKWNEPSAPDPIIAQTFKKVNGAVTSISQPIVPAASGSRMKTYPIPKALKKVKPHPSIKVNKFF
jgi:hypothetical protein